MIRIVGGSARGRRLQVPKGQTVRPTADRVRESLFNVLSNRLGLRFEGLRVLDLFAGAGSLGLEAASRGAHEICQVEADARVARVLESNRATVGVGGRLCRARVARFLGGTASPYDLVFLDPPYAAGAVEPTLTALARGAWLAPEALVCVEHPVEAELATIDGLGVVFRRDYGGTGITLLQPVDTTGGQ